MKRLSIIILIMVWVTPATASDWKFYGSARTHLGYYSVDKDFVGGPATDPSIRSNG